MALGRKDWHLTQEGQPLFWLADTAWNLWCRGTPEEWDAYLSQRKAQGFNAIQFVAGWWRGCMNPHWGRPFDLVDGQLVYNETAWQSVEDCCARIEAHGLIPAPIILWTLTDIDPGQVFSEAQCIEIGRHMVKALPSRNIFWLLGGDGDYTNPDIASRWKRIGQAVFGDKPEVMATLHPCGVTWTAPEFAKEPWYQAATIQSGHGSIAGDIRFLVDGRYSHDWQEIRLPHLNLEPNYEDAHSYGERVLLTDFHVRRASYWSNLVAPAGGITYGIGSIWMCAKEAGEIAENHDESWVGQPWQTQLETPGVSSVIKLKEFFEGLPWTELRPCPDLLDKQPGKKDPNLWQAAAWAPRSGLVVIYTPTDLSVALDSDLECRWKAYDPVDLSEIPCSVEGGKLKAGAVSKSGDYLFVGRP